MGVRGDLVIDREGQCKCLTTRFCRNAGLCASAHRVKEIFELKAKGFAFGDVRLGERQSRGGVLTGGGHRRLGGGDGARGGGRGGCREGRRTCSDRRCDCCCDDGWIDGDGQEFLTGEVE